MAPSSYAGAAEVQRCGTSHVGLAELHAAAGKAFGRGSIARVAQGPGLWQQPLMRAWFTPGTRARASRAREGAREPPGMDSRRPEHGFPA